MDLRIGLVLAASAATVMSGCTTAEQRQQVQAAVGDERQCFLVSQVRGFHAVDPDTVHVFVGPRGVYELEVSPTCTGINWSRTIAIRSRVGGQWICRGMEAELLAPRNGVNRCPVYTVRRLTQQEAEAARLSR